MDGSDEFEHVGPEILARVAADDFDLSQDQLAVRIDEREAAASSTRRQRSLANGENTLQKERRIGGRPVQLEPSDRRRSGALAQSRACQAEERDGRE